MWYFLFETVYSLFTVVAVVLIESKKGNLESHREKPTVLDSNLYTCIGGPILEEFLFRVIPYIGFYKCVGDKTGRMLYMLVSGPMFGILHNINNKYSKLTLESQILLNVNVILGGLIYGETYYQNMKTKGFIGSFISNVSRHGLHNFILHFPRIISSLID